mgnify:CR=1 FL=1
MLLYILKSIFCLFLFLGFYHLVLEKEKMHRFNRFYLLGSIVFAFIVPSFTITVITPTEFIEPVVQEFQMIEQMQTSDVVFVEETEINYMNYVYGLYIIVSGILCFFFIKNLLKILSKTKKNEKVSYYDATVILLKEKILPHTFLKYIFINKNEYANDQQEQLILTHELAHVKQKHSIDVLLIELLQIVFWCIPVFKLYKKAIQLNHEFLADDAVLKSHKNISEYQHILLNTSAQNNNIYLASNLNYSLTKKRLLMMTTPNSKTNILLKKLMVIPLTAGFIFAFAQRVEAQEKKQKLQIKEIKPVSIKVIKRKEKDSKPQVIEIKPVKIEVVKKKNSKKTSKPQVKEIKPVSIKVINRRKKDSKPQVIEIKPVKIEVIKNEKKDKKELNDFKERNNIVTLQSKSKKTQIREIEEQELKEAEKRRIAQEKVNKIVSKSKHKPAVTGGKMKMSILEYVKMWRKKDARFLYNKKPITGENAIKLVSKNKNIRVYTAGKFDDPTLVYISDKK